VVTTDGSITDIPRDEYLDAESRVISELKEYNKPFIVLLNCQNPNDMYSKELASNLSEKYEATVIPVNCLELSLDDINSIFAKLLYEFSIERVQIAYPKWISSLGLDSSLKQTLFETVKNSFANVSKVKDLNDNYKQMEECEYIKKVAVNEVNLGTGVVSIEASLQESLFYEMLSNITGVDIKNEGELFTCMNEFAKIKKEYDKLSYALHEVNERGYGIVSPGIDDLILEEPEIVKQGQRFGVKLKAKAPSIHMMRINTETEVSPIVGSEKQSEDLVKYLLSEFESDPKKIWESDFFGKSLHELVNEGLQTKLAKMPEEAQNKLRETLERIVNEGSGGLICIIL
jgi:stage IV sporulation protein A